MTWDPIWEDIFRVRDWGRYPPEELIRFVARNFYSAPDRRAVKILEIGCGPGANIWFFAREGFAAYGIDGSATAVEKARSRLAGDGLIADLQVGDVLRLREYYPPHSFDAVVDVACLQCNRLSSVEAILDGVREVLRPGGRVFSMLVAEGSYGYGLGKEVEHGTFVDISEGPTKGTGLCHFFALNEVHRIFRGFVDVHVEYSTRSFNERRDWYKNWIVEGVAGQ
jgi:SAM-dependent methyltransferase